MRMAAVAVVFALWLGPRNAQPKPLAIKPW
jgi:hypothetical protein